MKIVWERESATVRDVYEALLERRKVAYTTVMTMMKILEQKKYLKKTQADRAYVYRPAQPKGQVIGDMVRDFVNRVFNGSAEPLLVHLVEEHDLSRTSWKRSAGAHGEEVMTAALWWRDLLAWSWQILVLAAAGALAARLFGLRGPRPRLHYWQGVLAICLLLPALENWRPPDTSVNVSTSSARLRAPSPAAPARHRMRFAEVARQSWRREPCGAESG